jgi:hypothetical protein
MDEVAEVAFVFGDPGVRRDVDELGLQLQERFDNAGIGNGQHGVEGFEGEPTVSDGLTEDGEPRGHRRRDLDPA